MGFLDYISRTVDRKIALIEINKIVKLICIENTYLVNQPLLDTLVCDLNAFSLFANSYYWQCKETNELDKFQQFMTGYRELGYPCCDSLLYTLYAEDDQLDTAFSYLQKARDSKEPAAEYFYGHYQILHGDKKEGIAILKEIAGIAGHPFKKRSTNILEAMDIIEKSNSPLGKIKHAVKKGVKLVVKVLLLIAALINLFSGNIDGALFVACAYVGLKLLSYLKKYFFSPAQPDDELYLTLYDIPFEINNPLFVSQIKYPDLTFTEDGGILLPCSFDEQYDVNYTIYDESLMCYVERSYTNKAAMEEDLISTVNHLLYQINQFRTEKRKKLKELCKQGDPRAKFALQVFFDLNYVDGQFEKCENPIYFYTEYMEKLEKYID